MMTTKYHINKYKKQDLSLYSPVMAGVYGQKNNSAVQPTKTGKKMPARPLRKG